ncbi:MAG: DEAD/DEAH box helicase [Eggerthellaceae bacterium]|nr:DEAD/DEAH box helicase [Eggerthellaceae bacterium]
MTTFEQLGLSKKVLSAVERMGYKQPTPVQEKAIPLVLKGRDIIAAAQTGTGKTAAFSLPSMDKLGHAKGGSGPLMLVVTPTRELAQQIGEVASEIAVSTHHRIVTVVGGLSYKPQIDRLSRGCDILIATPGRLIDLMDQKAVRLADVQVLVLDEADRMLDMGFLPSVKKIVAATPKSRQTLLFSATIDKSIQDITGKMLRDPATVEIARKGDVAETVDHYVIRVPQSVKPALLKALLKEKGFFRVIVFARTRSRADSSCRRLRREGYKVAAIHSDRSQNQRKRALDQFANGELNIITATDVLARGIDVDEVDYVINYDVPEQPEDYIHRIGRTGRAGAKGLAITFVTPETEPQLRDIEKLIKKTIPEMELGSFDLAAAEAEAAANAINGQARRDPEVNKVKRELANRAQKAKQKSQETPAPRRRKKKGVANGTQKPSMGSGRKQKQNQKQRSAKQQAKGDFRPGRARRAEVQRSRNRRK